MAAELWTPFRSLSSDNFLSRGSAGQAFAINGNVVSKCPTLFINPAQAQKEEMDESIEKIEREKTIYEVLMQHPHPNIMHGIICVPEGFFMQRYNETLEARLELPSLPIVQERWIRQLGSAIAWLEELGYIHGDLRPANILLDHAENVKVGDFDAEFG